MYFQTPMALEEFIFFVAVGLTIMLAEVGGPIR